MPTRNTKNIAIVYGTYHHTEVMQMLEAVRKDAGKKKVKIVKEVPVPGSMEKPLAVKRLLLEEQVDAIVVLGIIEKGETQHGFVMGEAVIKSLIDLQLEFMTPIGVAILGPDIQPSQITSRLVPYALNAFNAACHMLNNP